MSDQFRFDGRVAVVTGAGNGLGKTYALLLASRGAKVVVNDLGGSTDGKGSDSRAADIVVEEIKKVGGEAIANYDSVTDGDKIIQTAMDAYGRVDIVINNAGILRDKTFAKMTETDWEIIYQVHVLGHYKVTKAAWDVMRKQEYGRVLNVISASGLYGTYGQSNYATAKLGLMGLTKVLAKEGAKKNIHVNCIAPVAVSRLTESFMKGPEMKEIIRPELVAPVVAYLCHESCKENGGTFEAGGGWVAKVRYQRSGGAFMPDGDFTPEAVAKMWDKAVDYNNEPTYHDGEGDSVKKIFKYAKKNYISRL